MNGPKKRQQPPMRIQNVFIFLLLAIFAICAIFLTALSAQVYRDTVAQSDGNNSARIISAIIRGAVQSEDSGNVSVREETVMVPVDDDGEEETVYQPGGSVRTLVFSNDYDGEIYLRRLYCADGWLWESFTAEEYGFTQEMGEPLIEAESFEPEVKGGLLTAKIVMKDGKTENVNVCLWAGGAEE